MAAASTLKQLAQIEKTMDPEFKKEIEKSKQDFIQKAEKMLKEELPAMIIKVTNMLTKEPWNSNDGLKFRPEVIVNEDGVSPPSSKKRKLSGTGDGFIANHVPDTAAKHPVITCNKKLTALMEEIKPLLTTVLEHTNVLKMWIVLLIPRIEDGNNFGVGIQEDTLVEIRSVESESANYLEAISRYHITRAKLITKLVKYPYVEDYHQSVRELDEKQFLNLRLTLCEIRNNSTSLFDLITKNIEKITKPRHSHHESLY